MNVEKLKRANELVTKLEALTTELKTLHVFAQELAKHNHTVKLTFDYSNLEVTPKEKKEDILDEDGSIIIRRTQDSMQDRFSRIYGISPIFGLGGYDQKSTNTKQLSTTTTEIGALQVLGLLISIKKEERKVILKELEGM